MKVVEFEDPNCRRLRPLFDSFVSDELSVEAILEVQSHIETCGACRRELTALQGLRAQLRRAVTAEGAPSALRAQVVGAVRLPQRRRLWLAAAACVGFLAAGWTVSLQVTGFSPPEFIAHELHIRELRKQLNGVARYGIADHIHCAFYRSYAGGEQSLEKTFDELGLAWAPIVGAVREGLPASWGVGLAHRCEIHGREFVHLAVVESGRIASVIVTRREAGESIDGAEQQQAEDFRIDTFAGGEFWGLIVSDLPPDEHGGIVALLKPPVTRFLRRSQPAWES